MFDLSDKRPKRRKTIMGYAQMDAQHGVLLAAMDFEWTCRRAILALSETPTVILYDKFREKEYSAFGGLVEAWECEVRSAVNGAGSLPDVVNRKLPWCWVDDAMFCRNAIVHGTQSQVTGKECRWAVCVLEDACDVIAEYVEGCGKDIFKRISRPRTMSERNEVTNGGQKLVEWRSRVSSLINKLGKTHWVRVRVDSKTLIRKSVSGNSKDENA